MLKLLIFVAFCCPTGVVLGQTTCNGTKVTIRSVIQQWLENVNRTLTDMDHEATVAEWAWATNITSENEAIKADLNAKLAVKYKELWQQSACLDCKAAACSEQETRRIKTYHSIGSAALPAKSFDDFGFILSSMQGIYAKAQVCNPKSKKCFKLDPGLTELMTESKSYCDLQWAWEGWRNETGRRIRGYYTAYVMMLNEAAKLNGFANAKDMWTTPYAYDEPNFFTQIEDAWRQVEPLYRELHAYARGKLMERYGASRFPTSGHIPAHIVGDMWAQNFDALYGLLTPYPDVPDMDITDLLVKKGWTVMDLFQESDNFFQSIGLGKMTQKFWQNSVFERIPNTEMVCHASAWDFLRPDDYRVKMCTIINQNDFATVHHEMGHIQYYMQYKNQPIEFRSGANPGFHEAIGDLIALSVLTPGHLKSIGLLPQDFAEDSRTSLNALMSMAMQKIAFLPFGYLLDKYRWSIFEGKTGFTKLNEAWWNLRCEYQGVSPPVPRSEEDFDAGAKFHVPASVPYIRYFFSHIAQFQFHKAICQKMGFNDSFHLCDIYNNTVATTAFRDAMALGSSMPYPKVMQMLTGTRKLDASALVDYFAPLYRWLQDENKAKGYKVGWLPKCSKITRNECNYNVASTNNLGFTVAAILPIISTYLFA